MEIGLAADWSIRGEYLAKHAMTPSQADEALADPNRIVIDPDPSSQSGMTIRVIGYSVDRGKVVTVIVLPEGTVLWGVNAWPSSGQDRRKYKED